MTVLILLLLCTTSALAGPLTPDENTQLQKTCGAIAALPQASLFKSTNTDTATRRDAPFAIMLAVQNPNDSNKYKGCSGTIVSKRYIVTAAHCLPLRHDACDPLKSAINQQFAPIRINPFISCTSSGTRYTCDYGETWTVARAFVSSHYQPFVDCQEQVGSKKGDVTVLELDKDIDFKKYPNVVAPACINNVAPKVGTTMSQFGYGSSGGDIGTPQMRKLFSRVIDRNGGFVDRIYSQHPEARSCKGDSGSGKVLFIDGRAHLTAVTSGGIGSDCPHRVRPEDKPEMSNPLAFNHEWICHAIGICPVPPKEKNTQLKKDYWVFEKK